MPSMRLSFRESDLAEIGSTRRTSLGLSVNRGNPCEGKIAMRGAKGVKEGGLRTYMDSGPLEYL
jgi:hypothetical protein